MTPVDIDDEVNTRITRVGVGPLAAASGAACLVIIHTADAGEIGRRYVFDKDALAIGRGRDNDVVLPSDAVSRRHARLERRSQQGKEQVCVVDLDSTNGTFVNDDRRVQREYCLVRGDLIKIGDTIFKYLSGSDVEAQYHDLLSYAALTDGLTDLNNRRQLDAMLSDEVNRARRLHTELTVLMLDLDHFKRVNDAHGHLGGDSVLRGVAGILQKQLRAGDKLGRYGGEEFCAILPDTSLVEAVALAESLRVAVAARVFAAGDAQVRVTLSIGAAAWRPGWSRDECYQAADAMLYNAKRKGRDRVCC